MVQFENAVNRYYTMILEELNLAGITCWLAGGALRDYFSGVPITTDYDIFFPSEIEYVKASTYFKAMKAVVKWESDNGMKIEYNKKTYDLVKKFFPDPQQTIDAFDFTVSMFAVDKGTVYHGATSFIDLAKRQLMINKITYPASTLSRAFRYYKKGFTMCRSEMRKIILAIQAMPKEDGQAEGEQAPEDISSGELGTFFVGID